MKIDCVDENTAQIIAPLPNLTDASDNQIIQMEQPRVDEINDEIN